MIKGTGFIMLSEDDLVKPERFAQREIRRRFSAMQKGIVGFLKANGPTPYHVVRQALAGKDTPITPSWKASFSRSVKGLKDKAMIYGTAQSDLMLHPAFSTFLDKLAVNNKGLKLTGDPHKEG